MKSSLSPLAVALAATLWSGFAVSSPVPGPFAAQALRAARAVAAAQHGTGTGEEPRGRKKADTGGGA